ncbi:MAG: hypothetical protein ACOYEJ_05135 [Mahellales bacterium]|jgi:hypothetical protein
MNKLMELFNDNTFQDMVKSKKITFIDIISILLLLSSRGIEYRLFFTPASNSSFAELTITFNISPTIEVSLRFQIV